MHCMSLKRYRGDKLISATIRFFNTTPTGRIINRFSRGELIYPLFSSAASAELERAHSSYVDVETIDSSLSGALRTVMVYFASLVAAIVSHSYSVISPKRKQAD
jgi:hypothetical protein